MAASQQHDRKGKRMPSEIKFTMPKGRMTIRKNRGRRVRLWELGNSTNPTVQSLEKAYLAGLAAVDRVEARHAANKADRRFTPDGIRDDLLKFVLSDAVPDLHRSRTAIAKARAEVTERRSKLKVAGPDKTDVASAFRRMEARTFLRDMKPDQQTEWFRKYGDTIPAEIAAAITELPPEFSGVPASRYEMLMERALDAQFGEEIVEIKQIEQAIEAAMGAVEAARDEVRLEVGIYDPAKFNELAVAIEAKHSAPWLRRTKGANGVEELRVVDLEQKVLRPATLQEIADGIVAETLDEYNERKVA
jgi:hypothetical protein